MKKQNEIHQQSIFDTTGLLPAKSWKVALFHIAILIAVVLLTEASKARADVVFDFQMKLAQKGNPEAQLMVGKMYETGRGVERNMEQAVTWVSKAAEQGNKAASFKLLYYDIKKNSLREDNKAQLDALVSAANAGDAHAQYYIGLMHSRGVGMRKDSTEALTWLSKASLQGITAAEDEIMRINESRQPKAPSTQINEQVNTKPAAQAEVNQQQQKTLTQSKKDHVNRPLQAAENRAETGRLTAQK